jgi:hypothetical protein
MSPRRRALALVVLPCAVLAVAWHSSPGRVEAQGATTIQVDVAANRRAIDPRIYGVNWADAAQLAALNVPLHRWGGNSTTRHNWKTNGDNRGSDWYFESIPGSGAQGAAFDDFVQLSRQNGSEPMVTIPLIGWVGKNGPGGTKLASFSAAKYGAQQDCDWSWFPDACNGVRTNGTNVTGNDPSDANVASSAQYQKEWAQHLVARWGLAASGGVRYYLYDNEPSLWHHTHRDVHPGGQTMTELRDLMIAYGTAIRQADPGAVFVGPEEWGWSGYFLSGYDQKYGNETGCWSCAPDKAANGGMDYMPWLLAQMQQHEQATGSRLLHVFSLHYYPQGGEFGSDTSSSMQARRNRSTRSLWDPGYTDETWIGDEVRLIPRMKEWVSAHYPGLATGITEYSWGADDHINGATAQADVLGIFGREGLDVGTRWVVPAAGTPTFKAIQMYRNYDGARSTFGDVSVKATAPSPDDIAAFAAERSSDGAVTVMAINKAPSSALVNLSLAHFAAGATAQVWRLTSANAIQHLADASVTGGAIGATLPAQSITLFVVPRSASPTPSLSIADVSVGEGASGSTSATFTIGLSAASSQAVTVDFATANGTATAGSDYTATSGTVTFTPGQASRTVVVAVLGDTTIEGDETFNVTLTGPTNATLADGQAVGTIVNDDLPTLSIGDVTVTEDHSGTVTATFTVSLSAASLQAVTVSYATANGTATAGSDYVAQAGNLAFAAGQTSRTIAVVVNGDTTVEPNETFLVNLSGPVGATIADGQGQGTITNDDVVPPSGELVSWVNVVGATPGAGSLAKTATAAWGNAGAASTRAVNGNGSLELTLPATSGYVMCGLSNGDSDQGYADIDFALYTYPGTGQLLVYEKGTYRGSFSAYAAGDILRVAVESGSVKYYRNAALLYSSLQAPVLPLRVDTSLYSTGSVVSNAVLSGTLVDVPSLPSEAVTWVNTIGASVSGVTLTKTAAASWTNAGAASSRGLNGDGYAEFTVPASPGYAMFGLGNGDTDQTYADIDYTFYTYPATGQLMVFEKGAYRGLLGAYAAGDKLRISVESNVVKYWWKSVLVYASSQAPAFPLRVDTSLYSTGAVVQGAILAGTLIDLALPTEAVAWQNAVGVSSTSSTLTKTAATAWGNAGASSTRGIPSGTDGYAEFTVPPSPGYAMLGLGNGDADQGYADVDFAFYLYPATGQLMVFEKGAYRASLGAYAAGDTLRVSVASGVVRYWWKGVLAYTSSQAPAFPLRVDTSLYDTGAVVQGATLGGSPVATP